MATYTGWLGTADSQSGQLLNGFDSVPDEFVPGGDLFATMRADPQVRWRKRAATGRAWMEPLERIEDPINRISAEPVRSDKFDHPWRYPAKFVRRRPLTHAIYTAAILEATLIPEAPEGGTIRPWYTPLSEPARKRTHMRPRPWYTWTALELDEAQRPEFVFINWLVPFSLPVKIFRKRWRSYPYPHNTLEMDAADRPELILADKWWTPLSKHPGFSPRIRAGLVTIGRLQLDETDQAERITMDKWYSPLSQHPGFKPMPNLPWTIAIGEEYLDTNFEVPLLLRLHRSMYAGGY